MPFDICIYGGTSAGVVAAVSAAAEGRSVALLNPSRHLGGMASGGLGATDVGNAAVIGGLAREFYRRVSHHYDVDEQWRIEPHVAERVFEAWLAEYPVQLLTGRGLRQTTKHGARLMALVTDHGETVEARVFIDASYEGDLMAGAGVSYAVGREPAAQYGESLNGICAETPHHQFTVRVDPYVKRGKRASGLLPCIQPGELGQPARPSWSGTPSAALRGQAAVPEISGNSGRPGDGDDRVQAYNFRLCLTQEADNRLPIAPPPGYARERYELLARTLAAQREAGMTPGFSDLFLIVRLPNDKADFNNSGAFSTDHLGANREYPEADAAARVRIRQDHEAYTRGLFHFLATDSAAPAEMRAEAQTWGLCRDEFVDTGGWPHQLYVREARRLRGPYVMTQADCEGARPIDDSVGMGSYTLDTHNCRRIVRDGAAHNEGNVEVGVSPYPIAYRSITPVPEECENLLVPVCLSASHVAHGSIRMEPVFMLLAQAAGLAAHQAIEEGRAVQEIDVPRLQQRLRQAGQVLEYRSSEGEPREWPHAAHVVSGD